MGNESAERAVSLVDVKVAIEQNGWTPEQLFRKDDILKLSSVATAIEAAKTEAAKTKDAEIADLKKQIEPLKRIQSEQMIADLVGKSALLTDTVKPAKDYILRQAKSMNLDSVPEAERTGKIDTFVKQQLEDIKNLGITFKPENNAANDKKKTDTQKTGSGKKDVDPDDFSDPANNDLIPDPLKVGV